jgi:hypothetical protein
MYLWLTVWTCFLMFIYHNVLSLIKICFFCFSTYLTENHDVTHSSACRMPACHYTYSAAPCLFLGQAEPYFRSQNAILWLCDVLHGRLSTISMPLPRLSHRKDSFCCVTCSMLPYFFSLLSYLTEGSLSYCMFDAQLLFGLSMYLTENTVVTTTAGVWHLWFLVVWLAQPLWLFRIHRQAVRWQREPLCVDLWRPSWRFVFSRISEHVTPNRV